MRKKFWIPGAAALIACTAFAAAQPIDTSGFSAKEKKEFDKLLENRTPGKPIDCVNVRDLGADQTFGENLVVFRGKTNASPVLVNRPPAGCSFRPSAAIKFRIPSSRLCRGDIIEVVDLGSRIPYGSCSLGDFVPYARQKG